MKLKEMEKMNANSRVLFKITEKLEENVMDLIILLDMKQKEKCIMKCV